MSRPARLYCATDIKATVGFEKLGEATETSAKSLIRMFGSRGNPQARNLFGVIGYLQREAGIELRVMPARDSAALFAIRGEPRPVPRSAEQREQPPLVIGQTNQAPSA